MISAHLVGIRTYSSARHLAHRFVKICQLEESWIILLVNA